MGKAPLSVLHHILLPFQLLLAFWQIVKLTPFGAIIQCIIAWLVLPFGLSPNYSILLCFPGRVFKTVQCHVITEADQPTLLRDYKTHEIFEIDSSYLGIQFHIERKEGNMIFLDGKMAYYITDSIWYYLVRMGQVAPKTVFLKGYKPFLPQVVTGGVMTLTEVLDCLIVKNKAIGILNNYLLLPVNLSVSDHTLLKFVNAAGLFLFLILKKTQVAWIVGALISFTSAMLEFSPRLRDCLKKNMSRLFGRAMLLLIEKLPHSKRMHLQSFGIWVEKLKFSSPIKARVFNGEICAVIGGGAKAPVQGATLVPWLEEEETQNGQTFTFKCGSIELVCGFDAKKCRCEVSASTVAVFDVFCDSNEFLKLYTFVSCIAKNRLGSLKTYGPKNTVHARGFKDSVICYAKSGFPPVYELKLMNVVVQY